MLRKMVFVLAAFFAVSALSVSVLVGVADAAAPGDPLYGLDRGLEELRLDLTTAPESKAKLQAELVQERLDEIQALAERGETGIMDQAIEDLNQDLASAPEGAPAAVANPGDPDEDLGPYCEGTPTKQHPVGAKLAQAYDGVEYKDVMGWACSGYGFGDIKKAYQISQASGKPVEDVFADFDSAQDWGEVMQAYGLKKPKDEEATAGEPGEPNQGAYCTGEQDTPHPTGERLAQAYGAEYKDIMDRFCQGYGFGEIKLAYYISEMTGIDVDAIFAEREEGAGWGEIMQAHELHGKSEAAKAKQKEKPAGKKPEGKKPAGKPTPKPKKNQ